ncbi:hypothetical protein ACFX2I_001804 [Malus domestica]
MVFVPNANKRCKDGNWQVPIINRPKVSGSKTSKQTLPSQGSRISLNPSTPTNAQPETLPLQLETRTREPKSNPTRNKPTGLAAIRLIVPLQGVIQGRCDLILGSLIPCALYYCLQLYLKRRRPSKPDPPSPSQSSSNLAELPRTPSRSSLSTSGPWAGSGCSPGRAALRSPMTRHTISGWIGLRRTRTIGWIIRMGLFNSDCPRTG